MTEFNEQKPTLYLIRGVSGSGKSTLAAQMSASMHIPFIEADMYFMENGVYLFNPLKLQEAQEPCGWDGAEEWEKLAWHLCAEENGEDACNELIWEGSPMPEP